jgi:hypothetical protein
MNRTNEANPRKAKAKQEHRNVSRVASRHTQTQQRALAKNKRKELKFKSMGDSWIERKH